MGGAFVLLHAVWLGVVPGDLDAFNFVLGVREYDVASHRPHPPGAPVYVVFAKTSVWIWRSLGLPAHPLAGPEAAALGALSLVAGSLSLVLIWWILRALEEPPERAQLATIIIGSAPLLWIAAARPLSDIVGLLLVLCAYLATLRGRPVAAGLLAGIAMGARVQTALLTIPALILGLTRRGTEFDLERRVGFRGKHALASFGGFTVGVVVWLLPLIALSRGPRSYWAALTEQAGEDLSSSMVLAATPTIRNAADALFNAFGRPWGAAALAGVMFFAALIGTACLQRTSRRHVVVLLSCIAPYVVFHLLFHETATVRYALPIVVVMAYLAAVSVESVPRRWRDAVAVALMAANLLVAVRAVHAYSRQSSPAMALLEAMHRRAAVSPPAFVTSHAGLMLPRVQEVLSSQPPWQTISSPAPYEWQSLVEHWRRGGSDPVWFVADPRRADLSLIDRRSQYVLGTFGLEEHAVWTVNGMRPKQLVWREMRQPSWIAVRGFALTPEIGGLAARSGHGPALGGAVALLRRYESGAVLTVGGRHVGESTAPPVRVTVTIDGRVVTTAFANPRDRHWVVIVHLERDQLKGAGAYATATISSAPLGASDGLVPVTVEHFDYQPIGQRLFAFGSGWHEPELQTGTGETWRWASRRATLFVHRPPGKAVDLKVVGGMAPIGRGVQWLTVTSGGRVLDTFLTSPTFTRHVNLPSAPSSDVCDVEITFESSSWMVPGDEGRSPDRRELAFRVLDVDITPRPAIGAVETRRAVP